MFILLWMKKEFNVQKSNKCHQIYCWYDRKFFCLVFWSTLTTTMTGLVGLWQKRKINVFGQNTHIREEASGDESFSQRTRVRLYDIWSTAYRILKDQMMYWCRMFIKCVAYRNKTELTHTKDNKLDAADLALNSVQTHPDDVRSYILMRSKT